MKFKVGDKVVVSPKANPLLGGLSGIVVETQESPIADTAYYKVDLDEERVFPEHHLIAETEYRFLTELNTTAHQLLATCGIKAADSDTKVLRAKDGTIIGDFSTGGVVNIHDLPTSEWYNPIRIDLPEFVFDAKQAKELAERLNKELAGRFNAFPNDGISAKNGGKNSMKFTFYVTDWVDINKTNGEKIPMKRTVAYIGSNTDVEADTSCPVAEYDERIGCLIAAAKISAKRSTEAKMMYNIARSTWGTELSWAILFELANDAFNGNFERVYKKFHNDNIRFEKKRLTCNFCGKVFETIEEKTKHENEHIQNKKNKREKYLIRKEAKRRLAEAEREDKIEQTMKELYKK